jgi:adenine-specific DNA-methyltransferase
MTEPEKLDLTSHNLPADKTAELLRLFPEIRTEGDKIDFDKLKLVLGQSVDAGKERYGMTWAGKADCFKTIQAPSTGTLLPVPEESVDFDTTENLIIEGDNLEVLKLLQKAYLGKVKTIYIDPPYNTGNDFIYPDNYTESLQTYLEYTGQVDAEGKKFGTNADTDGRFHSRWLNMMYPRLYLARNLLREDGVIFISIDDNEVDNLWKLCDEVFGEENFLASICWERADSPKMDSQYFSLKHDYLICYAKNAEEFSVIRIAYEGEDLPEHFNKVDENGRKYYLKPLRAMGGQGETREARPNLYYGIEAPDGSLVYPKLQGGRDGAWRWSSAKLKKELSKIEWVNKGTEWTPYYRIYADESAGKPPETILFSEDVGSTRTATAELKSLFEEGKYFDTPKPTALIKYLLQITSTSDDIVLDFFAGSGSTADAIFQFNKEGSHSCKFILVQLPEPTENEEFPTIADITKERVRRAIKKINDEEAGQFQLGETQDRGFRVFKLAESNFKGWEASTPKDGNALVQQLELHIDHIREGRTSEDILYEILLKSGFPLTTPVEKIELEGKAVYSVAGGGMLICLEKELTLEVIRAMAEKKPQRVICLDLGFVGNDQLKANAVQIFKTKEVVFKTV